MLKKWECLDSDICLHLVTARQAGEDSAFIGFRRDKLAEAVRKNHLPDFSNWKNHDAFERAFAPPSLRFGATSRLEKYLRATIS